MVSIDSYGDEVSVILLPTNTMTKQYVWSPLKHIGSKINFIKNNHKYFVI